MPDQSRNPVVVGLRVDVDTFRGTRYGVPRLLDILHRQHILATFFFTVGPDNMGRHLWRMFRPAFFIKILRSRAASLYGWDILLCGTCWPGRNIGRRLAGIIQATQAAGHEIGLHAWDHHRWQMQIDTMSAQEIGREIQKGMDCLQEILGERPHCSAAAGWRCNEQALTQKEAFWFHYNSDCRGTSAFRPVVQGRVCAPQLPVTLPTYDELIGRNNVDDSNYNDTLLDMIKPGRLNVLTIHAEVEGIARDALFVDFLHKAAQRNIVFTPLRNLLPEADSLEHCTVRSGELPGRDGELCLQGSLLPATDRRPLPA